MSAAERERIYIWDTNERRRRRRSQAREKFVFRLDGGG